MAFYSDLHLDIIDALERGISVPQIAQMFAVTVQQVVAVQNFILLHTEYVEE